jgi:hypothetical protein
VRQSPEAVAAWKSLFDSDLAAFAAKLRAAGLSERVVRAILSAQIDEQFRVREAALLPAKKKLQSWWQTDTTPVPLQTRLVQLALRREKSRLRWIVLGLDPDAPSEEDSPLSAEKLSLARMITGDYEAIRREGFQTRLLMPAEREQLDALQAEKRRELAAVLSPTELADYEMRTSPAVADMRERLHGFDATDAEFPAIFDYFKNYGAAAKTGLNAAVEQELEKPARAALGEERFAEFARAKSYDFRNLSSLAARAGLAPQAAVEVFDLRENIAKESARIGNDPNLPLDEKAAALQALAQNTRAQIVAKLGPAASPAYLKQADLWINAANQGIVTFSSSGWSSRTLFFRTPSGALIPGLSAPTP